MTRTYLICFLAVLATGCRHDAYLPLVERTETQPATVIEEEDETFSCILPAWPHEFPDDWPGYLQQSLELDSTETACIPPGTYSVWFRFQIDHSGKASQFRMEDEPGFGLGERTVNMAAKYPGRWITHEAMGLDEPAFYHQVVTYVITED